MDMKASHVNGALSWFPKLGTLRVNKRKKYRRTRIYRSRLYRIQVSVHIVQNNRNFLVYIEFWTYRINFAVHGDPINGSSTACGRPLIVGGLALLYRIRHDKSGPPSAKFQRVEGGQIPPPSGRTDPIFAEREAANNIVEAGIKTRFYDGPLLAYATGVQQTVHTMLFSRLPPIRMSFLRP